MATQTTFINSLLTAIFKAGTYTGGVITMKLFTTGLPSGSGVQVTGGGYAAQTLVFGTPALKKVASAQVTFTNLPTVEIKAYGIYSGATLIDEALLSPSFTADVTNNTLNITYEFDASGL